ncbi:MAG TPA: CHAT domain-containing protein [Steroidobacteraceae bacterium]|nr:CHAT domain-containing protein [Steroidobacteraceae bacterium]
MSRHAASLALMLALSMLCTASVLTATDALDPRLDAAIALYRQDGAQKALPIFQRLEREYASQGRRQDRASALHFLGECHWRLGRFPEARSYLDRALALERASKDRLAEGKTLNVLGLLEWDQGDYEQAIARFEGAGAVARQLGDKRLEGASLNNLSLVYDELGDYDVSLKQYREVLELYRDADFPRGVGDTLGNIGGVYLLLGRFREAKGYYEQALRVSERLDSKASMSQDHGNIALCLLGLGEIEAALQHFDRAIELSKHTGMRQDQAYWVRERGNGLIQQGRYDQGLASHRAALAIYEEIGAQAELQETLHDTGRLHFLLGDPDSAERHLTRALELARATGLSRGITLNLIALGELQFRRRQFDLAAARYMEARGRASESGEKHLLALSLLRLGLVRREKEQLPQALADVEQALSIARDIGARPLEAEALLARAELQRRRGRLEDALHGFRSAEAAVERTGDPHLLWQIYFGRARTLEARGEVDGAIAALIAAVTLIESVRDRLQESRFRAGYVEDKFEVYIDLVRLQLQQGRIADAFSTSDRLRARSYAEQLRGRTPSPLSAEDRRTETRLLERIRHLQEALAAEDTDGRPVHPQRAVTRFSREMQLAEQEYQAFLDDRASARPSAPMPVRAANVAALQRRLRNDEALLEYVVGRESLMTFVLTARGVTAWSTPLRRADLNARIALLRDLIRRPGDDRWLKPATRLSADLLDPIEDRGLLQGVQSLYVVPNGALNYLPFSVLARGNPGHGKLLIERYTVAYLPAASALLRDTLASSGRRTLLAVAPARSRLPYALEEARSIEAMFQPNARLLAGSGATESRFKTLAGGYTLLHLATHGSFNSVNPLLSGLELEADTQNDGLLQLHEVLELRLQASLVTLSACDTALGSGYFAEVPAGDEFVAMSRAFLAAGSASVMATLWEVDDRASGNLMTRFYARLEPADDASSPASALARAQRDLRGSRDLTHPYYWAPFILVGTMDPTSQHGPRTAGGSP